MRNTPNYTCRIPKAPPLFLRASRATALLHDAAVADLTCTRLNKRGQRKYPMVYSLCFTGHKKKLLPSISQHFQKNIAKSIIRGSPLFIEL